MSHKIIISDDFKNFEIITYFVGKFLPNNEEIDLKNIRYIFNVGSLDYNQIFLFLTGYDPLIEVLVDTISHNKNIELIVFNREVNSVYVEIQQGTKAISNRMIELISNKINEGKKIIVNYDDLCVKYLRFIKYDNIKFVNKGSKTDYYQSVFNCGSALIMGNTGDYSERIIKELNGVGITDIKVLLMMYN